VLFTPYVSLVHHEMASRAEIRDIFDAVSFQRQWGNIFLKGDPYFSPHLSLDSDDYLPDAEPVRQFTVGHPVVAKDAIRRTPTDAVPRRRRSSRCGTLARRLTVR
jgi:hypothetical protein